MYDTHMSTPGNTAKLGTAHSNIQTEQSNPSLVGSEPTMHWSAHYRVSTLTHYASLVCGGPFNSYDFLLHGVEGRGESLSIHVVPTQCAGSLRERDETKNIRKASRVGWCKLLNVSQLLFANDTVLDLEGFESKYTTLCSNELTNISILI